MGPLYSAVLPSTGAVFRRRIHLGYSESAFHQLTVGDVTQPDDLEIERRLYDDLLRGGRERYELDTRAIRGDGQVVWVHLTVSRVVDAAAETLFIVRTWEDIAERKRTEQILHDRAYHGPLTSLPNRALFAGHLRQALATAERRGEVVGILFLDLDAFKAVNDGYGHDVGDRLLQAVSRRLREALRASDTLARLAGDEFTLILPNIGSGQHAAAVARKLLEAIRSIDAINSRPVTTTASIGISLYPFDGKEADRLLQLADAAMYRAKSAGKDGYAFAGERTSLAP